MNEEQLIANFEPHEVATTTQLMECMQGVPSTDKYRRMVMLLLRGHYSHPDNYGSEYAHLGCYYYAPNRAGTLDVDLTDKNLDDFPDDFPGIYVGFGGMDLEKLAMGNTAGLSNDLSRTFVAKESVLTLSVIHVTKEPGHACQLADMSTMILMALGKPFSGKTGASGFEVEGYAPPKKQLPSPKRHYAVAMTVKIYYNLTVTRNVESHRIRRIAFIVNASSAS